MASGLLSGAGARPLGDVEALGCALGAGASSVRADNALPAPALLRPQMLCVCVQSLLYTPVDMTMIQQQKLGLGPAATIKVSSNLPGSARLAPDCASIGNAGGGGRGANPVFRRQPRRSRRSTGLRFSSPATVSPPSSLVSVSSVSLSFSLSHTVSRYLCHHTGGLLLPMQSLHCDASAIRCCGAGPPPARCGRGSTPAGSPRLPPPAPTSSRRQLPVYGSTTASM